MSSPVASTSKAVKGKSKSPAPARDAKKRFACTHEGCDKAYTKPARLKEHERVHTGERPFVCPHCSQSYRRDTHLNAHLRTHKSEEDKPLACTHQECNKRFWTNQHLRAHIAACHEGGQSFDCTQCEETFVKHHLLRSHIAKVHCPPGTRPFICDHAECDKSFLTGSKLRAHAKTHDESRYTCGHALCTAAADGPPTFPNWTALQKHNKTAHPPACLHPDCAGQTFASQSALRKHQSAVHDEVASPPGKRKRKNKAQGADDLTDTGGETIFEMEESDSGSHAWPCTAEGCSRSFQSNAALSHHTQRSHGPESSKVLSCHFSDCKFTARKQHVLERHEKNVHSDTSDTAQPCQPHSALDLLTGSNYLTVPVDEDDRPTKRRKLLGRVYPCPAAALSMLDAVASCSFAFKRQYDVSRHLKAQHGIDVDDEYLRETLSAVKEVETA